MCESCQFVPLTLNGVRVTRVVTPVRIDLQDNMGKVVCSRTQLPLILAYALTVHRAQGMTLESVLFDLNGLFAEGQLYTALSRVGDFTKFFIQGSLRSNLPCANAKVVAFESSVPWTIIDNGPSPGLVDLTCT